MRSFALAFLAGVMACQQLSDLPDLAWVWLLPFLCLFLFIRLLVVRVLVATALGFLWALFTAHHVLESDLASYTTGENVVISGRIVSLPEQRDHGERFLFDVETIEHKGIQRNTPARIRLSWYGRHQKLTAGERWQFETRLKPPRGFMNPGGFDYEAWLFQNRIRATGYVRKSDRNHRVEDAPAFYLHTIRQRVRDAISKVLQDKPQAGLITALAVGDRSDMSQDQWQVLTQTGTNHLMAISGLHIGMVAGFCFALVNWLWRRSARLCLRVPAIRAASWAAIFGAFAYAAIAGFSIPTQRALIMTLVVMGSFLLHVRMAPTQVLAIALLAVLFYDPLSVLSAGFWLSFIAVGAILFVIVGRLNKEPVWKQWIKVQWILALALAPVLLVLFQRLSLVAPLANLIAVPVVSFVIVPLTLVGALLQFAIPLAGESLLFAAQYGMNALYQLLEFMIAWPAHVMEWPAPATWTLIPASIGLLWWFLPRGFPARWVGALWLLPLFFVKPDGLAHGEAELTLLDVGQGLAAVVQTQNHILVFDTGPAFSETFDTGEAVLVPFLRHLGVRRLDTLIVSHGDNDHIGGVDSLLQSMPAQTVLTGVPHLLLHYRAQPCEAGSRWEWDGVQFQVLYPPTDKVKLRGNDGSCVMQVDAGGRRILLTGDIEKKSERFLIESSAELRADVLVVPHHGSKTSSTPGFIETVKPQYGLIPVGFRNRYHLPNADVMARYRQQDVTLLSSADSGAISLRFSSHGLGEIREYRASYRRYWNGL